MKRKTLVLVSCLFLAGTVLAARPAKNVSSERHPNLAAAQRLCQQAYDKIAHAQKAKELLEQASEEIKQAALAANDAH